MMLTIISTSSSLSSLFPTQYNTNLIKAQQLQKEYLAQSSQPRNILDSSRLNKIDIQKLKELVECFQFRVPRSQNTILFLIIRYTEIYLANSYSK